MEPTVLLAANTPLYAPIFLAKAIGINETCCQLQFEVEHERPITSKTNPSSRSIASDLIDPFVRKIFSKTSSPSRILLGIGDPMRITQVPENRAQFREPLIRGGIIRKMCYWLIDNQVMHDDQPLLKHFNNLIVHPLGMTGYSVAYHLLKSQRSTSFMPDDDIIAQCLFSEVPVGLERHLYDAAVDLAVKRKREYKLAFLTTDPVIAEQAHDEGQQYDLAWDFLEADGVVGDLNKVFHDSVMTAIISRQDADMETDERKAVNDVITGIHEAIQMVKYAPDLAASLLYIHAKSLDVASLQPFYAEWPLARIKTCLKSLGRDDVYNLCPNLSISAQQWNNSTTIRRTVEELMTAQKIAIPRGADTIQDGRNVHLVGILPTAQPHPVAVRAHEPIAISGMTVIRLTDKIAFNDLPHMPIVNEVQFSWWLFTRGLALLLVGTGLFYIAHPSSNLVVLKNGQALLSLVAMVSSIVAGLYPAFILYCQSKRRLRKCSRWQLDLGRSALNAILLISCAVIFRAALEIAFSWQPAGALTDALIYGLIVSIVGMLLQYYVGLFDLLIRVIAHASGWDTWPTPPSRERPEEPVLKPSCAETLLNRAEAVRAYFTQPSQGETTDNAYVD